MTVAAPLETLVRDALACVETECPAAALEMKTALGARVVALDFGTESFRVALAESAHERASLSVSTTAAVMHAILAGDRDPLDAILDDAVVVRGAATDLEALSRTAMLFVKGAVRCPSMDALLNRLKHLSDSKGEWR